MATPAEAVAAVTAKIIIDFGWDAQFASDYLDDLDDIKRDETRWQLRYQLQGPKIDSNVTYQILAFEVVVHHHLADFLLEESYTSGQMLTDQQMLMDTNWWRDIDQIHDVTSEGNVNQIALSEDVSRIGDVVSYGVLAIVSVTP